MLTVIQITQKINIRYSASIYIDFINFKNVNIDFKIVISHFDFKIDVVDFKTNLFDLHFKALR